MGELSVPLQALHLCRSTPTPSTLHFITRHLLRHTLTPIANTATQVAVEIVEGVCVCVFARFKVQGVCVCKLPLLATALGSNLSSGEASQLLTEMEVVRSEGGRNLQARLRDVASESLQDHVTTDEEVRGKEQRQDDVIHPLTKVLPVPSK